GGGGLWGAEGGRRLVQEDQARVERESARDRDEVALPGLEVPDRLSGRDGRLAESRERLGRTRRERARVHEAGGGRRLAAEEDVLGGRQRLDELQLLGNDGDAARDRLARIGHAAHGAVE